jgi:hypothetical protein
MAAITRRQYTGNAVATTITAGISATDVTCTLASTTGWPTLPSVPFFVVIDPGNSKEEKCSATISGPTLTLSRNKDNTNNVIHDSGAVIYPVFTATEADEANLVASTMIARGDLLTMNSSTTVARLPVGATSGYVLTTDGTDPSWGQVVAAGIATGAVTSDKILNNTIVDTDISTTAAIAQSKIATLVADLAAKAPLASPTFTGTVTAPTFSGALTGNVTGNVTGSVTGTASNATKVNNYNVYVGPTAPASPSAGDIWIQATI